MRPSFRPRRRAEAEAVYQAFLSQGYPVTLDGNAETLQCATDTDRGNWLIFLGVCEEAIAAKAGDDPIPIPIRCASNRSYTITYAQAQAMIVGMRSWGFAAQANCWRLKDLIASAETGEALNAVDLTEGWP